ncbi:PAS domain-containing hybrid sensor histidine kinase/response regulator [Variovorax sp. RA8]|uniref:PAS domain-containing hybrid sensor histidine kinase/response regulator n=1 Tax=Variovorax sp. (strain JCM 16519 / RA8) TaxID=662548 RepID=UPI0013167F53|nr:PAS domain S-box protein [Variovorax sp. RA8]VTU13526.1 Aerobic respiration control sensor protein ArcB [Variovorax sp. RA8]
MADAREVPFPPVAPPPALTAPGDADFRLMVDAVGDYAIFLLDPGGVVRSWNTGARRIKGYAAHEVIGRHFSIFYPAEQLERGWPEHELKVARETGRFEDEGWRLRKDGTRFWANVIITRLIDADGHFRGFSKITRDLTDRRRHEEQLRMSEERFRLLMEGVKDYAIFMLDPSGHVVSWNAGARRFKGYEAHEIIGRHFSTFYPPDAQATGWPNEELRIARRDGRFQDEGWRVRKDGTRFWAGVVITALHDETGTLRGFAKVTRDLTEQRRASSLEDEGRRISTFLAMLGHELRNPLAPISNALALMAREKLESRTLRLAQETIARQLKQMVRLVDDLLDIGRITSGKIRLEAKPVDLKEVVAEAIEATAPAAENKSQQLRIEADDTALWVTGDRARLIQVLSNLVGNAIKFTPAGGHVHVRADRDGDKAVLTVRDDGPGIASQDIGRIFNLFEQGEQDVARLQGGLGLGLSLVQQLVSLHSGDVAAYSRGVPGEGSEFVVRLPLSVPPTIAERGQADGTQLDGRPLVLVVDDNQDSAHTMAELMEVLGCRASVRHDGPTALDAIKQLAPDLVLLDIGLPGLSGLQVAERVRAEVANPPPLIAITGYGQERDRQLSFDAGFFAHLTKPVDADQLEDLLRRLLDRR